MAACGWCLAFDDTCCEGRKEWCEHTRRCQMILGIKFHSIGFCAYHGREHHSNMKSCMKQKELIPMTHIVQEAWRQLDQQVHEIVLLSQEQAAADRGEPTSTPKLARELYGAKQRARGKAEILALLMPTFADADAIAAESGRRYGEIVAGRIPHTPGMPAESEAPGWFHAANGEGFTSDPAQAGLHS